MMEVGVIGISHHTAAVAAREQFALSGEQAGELLHLLNEEDAFGEAMVLDTCNRTEVYFVARDETDPLEKLIECLARAKGVETAIDPSMFYQYRGRAVTAHLFRVAAGLESQIVGEHQILGQIKAAYQLAQDKRTARFLLNKMLHQAFRVGKRIRTETQLGRGSTSAAHAAVDLAGQIFSSLEGKNVLLVGAGETAELAARVLMRREVASVTVANRTLSRAQQVAEGLLTTTSRKSITRIHCPAMKRKADSARLQRQGAAAPSAASTTTNSIELAQIPDVIGDMDLVICSTASPDVVLRCEELDKPLRRSNRSLLIVDIAVPRDVDVDLGRLDNVFLYNMDDLDRLVAQNIQRRRQEIPRAEAIVEDEVRRFARWISSLQVTPTIKLLQQRFEELTQAEVGRYGSKFCSHDRRQLDKFTGGLCRKMLHQPIAFLHELSEQEPGSDKLAAIDMVRRMFQLDDMEDNE